MRNTNVTQMLLYLIYAQLCASNGVQPLALDNIIHIADKEKP